MSDLISMIVPVYNAAEYLNQCIESILNQTYENLEIILIDDGSEDNSAKICRRYQEQDNRIKIISQSNGGSVSARKAGLRAANGIYIGFVDADDYIEPTMFERLYQKLTEFGVDFVHSGRIIGDRVDTNFEEGIIDFTIDNRVEYVRDNVFKTQKMFYPLWSKLFKADLIKDAFLSLPDEQCYGEDLLCMCNYLSGCRKFYMLKEAYYHYRVREGTLSHINWFDTCIEENRLYTYILKKLEEKNWVTECGDSAKQHCKDFILNAMKRDKFSGISIAKYVFGEIEALRGKKVVLYGAGNVGKDYYYQIVRSGMCELVAWVDKEKYGVTNLITVEKPDKIKGLVYDVIVIAVINERVAINMKEDLIKLGIDGIETKIIWKEPVKVQ